MNSAIRRLIVPVLLLASGVVALLVFAALLLTDQWLQSGSPVVEGKIGEQVEFKAEGGRYAVRMGRRRELFEGGPNVRVSQAVARGAQCVAAGADGRQEQLRRETYDDEGGITPLIDTFEPAKGRTRVRCVWDPSERFRGPLPFFVAHERTFLRRLGYAALVAALLLLALGGWRLYRALTTRP